MSEPVLCLAVDGRSNCFMSAWFTTRALSEQKMTGWDEKMERDLIPDVERPSNHRSISDETLCGCDWCIATWDGNRPRWRVVRVAFLGPFYAGHLVDTHTPREINERGYPWLETTTWDQSGTMPGTALVPGMTLSAFIRAVRSVGGRVYTSPDEVWGPVAEVPQEERRAMNIGTAETNR